ncbi:ferrous iron transport protein B [Cellulomonas soli]|uniref:ferrous iron transport protein B n=1 Tax=Cellulomonas soli TaxID=931535 RepID=UPI003F8592E5
MSCHDAGPGAGPLALAPRVGEPTVALVGNPNVGKSTLFNALTGAHQQVVNAPGTTVEMQTGTWRDVGGARAQLVDLPGTYSLLARTPDEQVTADAVAGRAAGGAPDLVLAVVEAAGLARSLYLLGQVALTGRSVVVALTMSDVAASRGVPVDPERLAVVLGVPVVTVDPRTGAGRAALAAAVADALDHPTHVQGLTVTEPDGRRPDGAEDLADADQVFGWVAQVQASLDRPAVATPVRTWSDRVDSVLLHPWVGVPVFAAVMWGLFQLATAVAAPLMDAVDTLVNGWIGDGLRAVLPSSGGFAWVEGLLVDGVLAGVGTVLSFAPLMGLMFVAIAVLEDSGYLARAAFVADRAMRLLGLDGRAVLPLVVGFGCNLPALAATRTLPHARQRLLTGLIVPYTSCAARLTVYILLATVFFPANPGTAIFLMYVASVVLVVVGGLLLRRTAFRDVRTEPFVLALPAYQRPRVRALLLSAWVRVRAFVLKAGRIIVVTLTAVWVLMAVPVTGSHPVGDVPVEDSLYGSAAQAIAPVFTPAGFGSWQASAALATGFVAKEVVVGSFAQSFAVAEPEDPSQPGDLGTQMRATFERTSGGHPAAAAAAFMVFVLAYSPCLATIAEQRRLFGVRWTLRAVGVSLGVAWLAAVLVFQVASRLGGAS